MYLSLIHIQMCIRDSTEYTGTTVDEVMLAADSIIADGADAVFTPSDNTIMTAELSIYEELAEAGIPHYAGADSFALNGAFCGYGVDYINLGVETANMINSILVDGEEMCIRDRINCSNTRCHNMLISKLSFLILDIVFKLLPDYITLWKKHWKTTTYQIIYHE